MREKVERRKEGGEEGGGGGKDDTHLTPWLPLTDTKSKGECHLMIWLLKSGETIFIFHQYQPSFPPSLPPSLLT